jgi:2-polyprenyl-3-methyl-5-hydroxy-6-metoxy-1,4-benzoquinol methylase
MHHSTNAAEIFNKHASLYQEKYMDVHRYAESLDQFCQLLANTEGELLDVACGPGNITQYLLNQRPGLQILGIDLAPNMLELARKNNPTAKFTEMDCRHISQLNQRFDGIILGFCLPYLNKDEAIQLVHDATAMLNPKGILYLSTMEDDYEKSRMQTSSQGDQLFMYFHQADYLVAAIEAKNLELVYLKRLAQPGAEATAPPDLVIVAKLVDRA